jgi:hypothetical protein
VRIPSIIEKAILPYNFEIPAIVFTFPHMAKEIQRTTRIVPGKSGKCIRST